MHCSPVAARKRTLTMFKGPIALATLRTGSVLGLRLIAQTGTLLLLASTLAVGEFGLYTGLGAMAVLLGTLANFGTHLTLLRDVSRNSIGADEAIRLALGTTVFCGAALLFIYVAVTFVWLSIPHNTFWAVLCLGIAEVFLQPFLVVAAMELHGRGQTARSQLLLILPLLLRFLLIFLVAWFAPESPLLWCASGHLIAVMVALGYVVMRMSAVWREPSKWLLARRSRWRDLAGYAVMNTSANGVSEIDKVLAVRLLPFEFAGIYSAASRIVGALVLPVMAMILAAIPRLFRDGAASGRQLQYWLFALASGYGLLVAVAIAFAAPWIESLLGVTYAGVGELIHILAYAVPAMCVRTAAMNMLTTLEQPWMRICLELVGWSFIVVMAIILVRTQAGTGLALSIICAEWFLAIASVVLINVISTSAHKPLR